LIAVTRPSGSVMAVNCPAASNVYSVTGEVSPPPPSGSGAVISTTRLKASYSYSVTRESALVTLTTLPTASCANIRTGDVCPPPPSGSGSVSLTSRSSASYVSSVRRPSGSIQAVTFPAASSLGAWLLRFERPPYPPAIPLSPIYAPVPFIFQSFGK
jgi:hypothetical protein